MNRSTVKNWLVVLTLIITLTGCSQSLPTNKSLSATGQPAAAATPIPPIQLEPCQLGDIPAQCGVLTVFENRLANIGRTIDIHVAVIKASSPDPAPDPIFYITGGPGSSGLNDAAYAMQVLKSANQQRDLVLFDQRGTGQSNRMACPRRVDESFWLAPIEDKMLQDLKNCLDNLDGDPAAYTTAWGMDDLDDIRAALGYDQINLYGESYGATAEQVFLQRHGDHVRSMALEGVSMFDVPMFERMPRSSQEALDLLLNRCQADPTCSSAYPNLRAEVTELIVKLDKAPEVLSLTDPYTGQPFRLTRDWLVLGIHNLLVLTPTAVMLPGLIHQAYTGDWSTIENNLSGSFTQAGQNAEWSIMNLTILCNEDWARLDREETSQYSEGSYLGYEDVRRYVAPEQVCALIPKPQPEALYQPLTTSPVPVLIFSNQADPQNPPENVATAKDHFPNSLTLVAPGQGHGYTGIPCRDQILAEYFGIGSTQGLHTDCLQTVALPPFP